MGNVSSECEWPGPGGVSNSLEATLKLFLSGCGKRWSAQDGVSPLGLRGILVEDLELSEAISAFTA